LRFVDDAILADSDVMRHSIDRKILRKILIDAGLRPCLIFGALQLGIFIALETRRTVQGRRAEKLCSTQ
jgi:hypothetical protein